MFRIIINYRRFITVQACQAKNCYRKKSIVLIENCFCCRARNWSCRQISVENFICAQANSGNLVDIADTHCLRCCVMTQRLLQTKRTPFQAFLSRKWTEFHAHVFWIIKKVNFRPEAQKGSQLVRCKWTFHRITEIKSLLLPPDTWQDKLFVSNMWLEIYARNNPFTLLCLYRSSFSVCLSTASPRRPSQTKGEMLGNLAKQRNLIKTE